MLSVIYAPRNISVNFSPRRVENIAELRRVKETLI